MDKIKGASTMDRQRLGNVILAASEAMSVAEKKQLIGALTEVVQAADAKNSKAAARIAKVEASSKDESMQVAFRTGLRGLRRLGLDIDAVAAAGDTKALDKAMTEQGWKTGERLQLKVCLANCGVID